MFDENVDKVLEATAKGDVDRRLQTMTAIIVTMAVERFGVEEGRGVKRPYTKNQRAVKIHNIRLELKTLKKQYKAAGEEECGPLHELRCILRKKLFILRRAEQTRRERARKRVNLSSPNSSSGRRDQELGKCDALITPPEPVVAFEPLLKEVQEVVRKARSRSAPGPSGTSYKVYKYCPKLLHWLWRILKSSGEEEKP